MSVTFEPGLLKAYFVAGSQDVPGRDLRDVLATMLRAGITAYQFRDKGASTLTPDQRLALGRDLRDQCRVASVPFIVDDDVELAQMTKADGIHVGQSDEKIQAVIQAVGGQMFIGLSCSNQAEILAANAIDGIDYYGSGPVFPTGSKADADPVIGLAGLKQLVGLSTRPIVGIGGITVTDLPDVIKAGAAGSAVISMIAASSDIAITVGAMLDA